MRLLVHLDQAFRRDAEGTLTTAQPFVRFVAELTRHVDAVTVAGRLDPAPGRAEHVVPAEIGFVALPHYASAARPGAVAGALAGSCRAFSRALADADAVWLIGPNPLSLPFAALALARGCAVALGVRQDLPRYARHRHPGRRAPILAAELLDGAFRLLARHVPAVVVGPELARRYRRAPELLQLWVSLMRAADVGEPSTPRVPREVLSVGRIDTEKNPLLLADVLARLDPDWRLVAYGDGPLRGALAQRLQQLGVTDRARLPGHVALDDGLLDAYRRAGAVLHVSWTEGLPQVLLEAFAAGAPVVATDVGGVRAAVGDAALLVAPGDAEAAATALQRLDGDPQLRARLVEAGLRLAREHSLETEAGALAAALQRWASGRPTAPSVRRRRRGPATTSASSRQAMRGRRIASDAS